MSGPSSPIIIIILITLLHVTAKIYYIIDPIIRKFQTTPDRTIGMQHAGGSFLPTRRRAGLSAAYTGSKEAKTPDSGVQPGLE